MTAHSTQYKLADAERQKRMDEFAETDQPTALTAEISAARLMLEEALNAGHHSLATALLQTLAKLGNAHTASQLRIGELLEKSAVLRLATQLVNLATETVRDRFPGWEDAMEDLADKVVQIVVETDNDNQPKLEAPK
jgi:hypothetical protein